MPCIPITGPNLILYGLGLAPFIAIGGIILAIVAHEAIPDKAATASQAPVRQVRPGTPPDACKEIRGLAATPARLTQHEPAAIEKCLGKRLVIAHGQLGTFGAPSRARLVPIDHKPTP